MAETRQPANLDGTEKPTTSPQETIDTPSVVADQPRYAVTAVAGTTSPGEDAQEVRNSPQVPPADFARVQETLEHIDKGIGDITRAIRDTFKDILPKSKGGPDDEDGGVSGYSSGSDTGSVSNATDFGGPMPTYAHNKPNRRPQGPFDDSNDESKLSFPANIVPQVKDCDWGQFKSRYATDTEEPVYAIEALSCGLFFEREAVEWARKVSQVDDKGGRRYFGSIRPHTETQQPEVGASEKYIRRVRVNTQAVIKLLASLPGVDKMYISRPVTFFEPFRPLVHFHSAMKAELSALQQRLAATKTAGVDASQVVETAGGASISGDGLDAATPSDAPQTNEERVIVIAPLQEGNTDYVGKEIQKFSFGEAALAELQCYVDFVETRLMPYYTRFPSAGLEAVPGIRFDQLRYLFKTGGLIHTPYLANSSGSMHCQTIWRVHRLRSPTLFRIPSSKDDPKSGVEMRHGGGEVWNDAPFDLDCYYIDYDGERYRAIMRKFSIARFEGMREITQLFAYPIQFMKDYPESVERAKRDGAKFVELIEKRYGYYSGWTMIKTPSAESINDPTGNPVNTPEHIESDVLVDFRETFNAHPFWRPQSVPTEHPNHEGGYLCSAPTDRAPVTVWSDSTQSRVSTFLDDVIYEENYVEKYESTSLWGQDPYLKAQDGPPHVPSGEDLALLPRRLFAYAVWERKFVHIDIRYIQARATGDQSKGKDGKRKQDAFDKLQIGDRHKQLIQSLVHSHFKKKDMESRGFEIGTQDLIRGKGKGVVILLHGVPGVGKTATAEAVAQRWAKPLFPITCGDLGFTPESVQNELEEIFRLAHLWDCVLLLDEADVFITQRERNELQRNALVSVFLRMLEYYNGILFLTTNRAGVLDEAVKSRVHLNLRYDHLNEDQTVEVFRNNIEKLREIESQRGNDASHKELFIVEQDIIRFAREHYQRGMINKGVGRWNGRQIRNAFLIAASLAHYEAEASEDAGMQKQLRGSHFQDVEAATLLYDQFRESTLGANDADIAYTRIERNDYFTKNLDRRDTMKAPMQTAGGMQPPYQSYEPRGQRGASSATSHPMYPPSSMTGGDQMTRSASQTRGYAQNSFDSMPPSSGPSYSSENTGMFYDNMNPSAGSQAGHNHYSNNSTGSSDVWAPGRYP